MCKLFKRPEAEKNEKYGSFSDEVRKFARTTFITPARMQGKRTVSFSSSEIHEGLKYENRYPLVCSAIDAQKFCKFAKVKLVNRSGPKASSTVRWTYEILHP